MWDDVVEEDAPKPAEVSAAPPAEGAEGAAPEETKPEEAEPPPPENITRGNEPKRLVCKHWVR